MYTELFVFALAQEVQQQAHVRAAAQRDARKATLRRRRPWRSRRTAPTLRTDPQPAGGSL